MKKLSMFIICLLVFTQINIYALQNKESLNPFAADDKTVIEDKDSTMKVSENKPKKKARLSMGLEGGYMWELYDANAAPDDLSEVGLNYNMPNYAKVGLTFALSEMYKEETGIAKHSSSTSLGYIFIENGWGVYATIDYNRNFKLDKKGNSYFYIGLGTGISYTYAANDIDLSDSSYMRNDDIVLQALRVPVGFKFMLGKDTELFFESSVYLGMMFSATYIADEAHSNSFENSQLFSLGVETKGGLRFLF